MLISKWLIAYKNKNFVYRQHTNERPYECIVCEFRTNHRNVLRRHYSSHLLQANLFCPHEHCIFSTAQINTFKNHILTKHRHQTIVFSCHVSNFLLIFAYKKNIILMYFIHIYAIKCNSEVISTKVLYVVLIFLKIYFNFINNNFFKYLKGS